MGGPSRSVQPNINDHFGLTNYGGGFFRDPVTFTFQTAWKVDQQPFTGGTVVASNGNRTATQIVNGTNACVVATQSRNAGKYCWELVITALSTSTGEIGGTGAGLVSNQAAAAYFLGGVGPNGNALTGIAFCQNSGAPCIGTQAPAQFTMGAYVNVQSCTAIIASGDVLTFAVDCDADLVTMYRNGALFGPTVAATISPYFPFCEANNVGAPIGNYTVTGNFRRSDFVGAVPAGFKPWDEN